jgi:hypothetical protein
VAFAMEKYDVSERRACGAQRHEPASAAQQPGLPHAGGFAEPLGNCSGSDVMGRSPVVFQLLTQSHCRP